jgi:hypothetical protein
MKTSTRLKKLKDWLTENACSGRNMKAPGSSALDIRYKEPTCRLCIFSTKEAVSGINMYENTDMAPGILVLMNRSGTRDHYKKRDKHSKTQRPMDLREFLELQIMFVAYDPGHRTDESQQSGSLEDIMPNDEEASFAVLDWAEETMQKLMENSIVPGTDLIVDQVGLEFGPLKENGILSGKKPLYCAVLNCTFGCASQAVENQETISYLD